MRSIGLVLAVTALLASSATARAEITINEAEYAAGVTVIRGETVRPNQLVTADRRYRTRSNRVGRFTFRIRYLPDDCIVSLRAGRVTRPVTINNCFMPSRGLKPMPRRPR